MFPTKKTKKVAHVPMTFLIEKKENKKNTVGSNIDINNPQNKCLHSGHFLHLYYSPPVTPCQKLKSPHFFQKTAVPDPPQAPLSHPQIDACTFRVLSHRTKFFNWPSPGAGTEPINNKIISNCIVR